jgi:SOS-response transcriptional repressor LexA
MKKYVPPANPTPDLVLNPVSAPAPFHTQHPQEHEACVSMAINTAAYRPARNTFALRVIGDSMIVRHICDGDILVFEPGADPRPGQVVAASVDGKSTIRTFLLKNGRPLLKAANPTTPAIFPGGELTIQGVARVLIRKAPRESALKSEI